MSNFGLFSGFIVGAFLLAGCNVGTIKRIEKPKPDPDPIALNAKMPEKTYVLGKLKIYRDKYGKVMVVDATRTEFPIVDPHGPIERVSDYSDTCNITTVVSNPEEGHDVKVTPACIQGKPKVFGWLHGSGSGNHYYRHLATGQDVRVSGYLLGSSGIAIALDRRTFMMFDSDDTDRPKIVSLPEDYYLSDLQPGDVSFTRHILIRRYVGKGKILGFLETKEDALYDFAWFNVDTGKLTTIFNIHVDISIKGTSVDDYARELIDLVITPEGPISITREGSWWKKLIARNLFTGKKVLIFERDGGISGCKVTQDDFYGPAKIESSLGFQTGVIDDLVKFMNGAPVYSD